MSFQKNDRIRVIGNGFMGTVDGVSFNSIHQETEYYVTWDWCPEKGSVCYMASDADDIWEKVAQIKDAQILSTGHANRSYVNQDPDVRDPMFQEYLAQDRKECKHKWVEVGFTHTKTVCYHCDTEKK